MKCDAGTKKEGADSARSLVFLILRCFPLPLLGDALRFGLLEVLVPMNRIACTFVVRGIVCRFVWKLLHVMYGDA